MGFRSCISLPVILVLLVTLFIYFTIVFLVLDPWLDFTTSAGVFNLVLFSATTLMALFSYALAVLRDPGRVPSSYMPDIEEAPLQEIKRKGGDLRYCQKCRLYKPPRAHHCRICKRCVLRMDHHCVWINNCVGHYNYKAFFLFVLYITSASVYSLVVLILHTIELGKSFDVLDKKPVKSFAAASTLLKIICAIILVPVSVTLTVLLGWHIYLCYRNKTTIEYYEGTKAVWLAEDGRPLAFNHPYDLGPFMNMVIAFGPHASCWLCPTAVGHIGSGLHFRTSHDSGLRL